MAATVYQHSEAGLGTSGASVMAAYAKRLAEHLVADCPFISVDTTTSDTSTSFDQTLALSFDENTKVRVYNSSSSGYKVDVLANGTADVTTGTLLTTGASNMMTTYVVVGDNFAFVLLGLNGSEISPTNGFFVGKIENYYDNLVGTIYSPNADFYASGTSAIKATVNGVAVGTCSQGNAFPRGYANWGGTGHLYCAVPQYFYKDNATTPVCGFVGGTDSIYTIYDNHERLEISCGTTFTINNHEFFCIVTSSSIVSSSRRLVAVRLS